MKMFVATLLALASCSVAVIYCPPGTCSGVPCPSIENCDGRVDQHGGYCGCCPACIKQIGENERCLQSVLLGARHDSVCAEGLFCNLTSGVCEKKTCDIVFGEVNARLDAAKQAGNPLLGVPVPSCETDGTYKPVQCTGSVCYCVNKKGESLYLDEPNEVQYSAMTWQRASMDCSCARDQDAYLDTGLIGKTFDCEANGNYKKVACTGSVCYCVDENGEQVGTSTVNIGQQDSLNC